MSTGNRSTADGQAVFGAEASRPRKRQPAKKPNSFKPHPVRGSSDTPPEDVRHLPPPPPSERKIARRRESTRKIRQRDASASPSRDPQPSSSKRPRKDEAGPDPNADLFNFIAPSRPRQAVPRPSSPPRPIGASSRPSGVGGNMGLPTGFVRKTRKSVRGTLAFDDFGADAVVPVPERETPMIRKNKELREAQQRRSSLGMRGQRASSSLGRGEISIPHHTVDSALFYNHLGSNMPEPIRARHLIAWCAKRALDADLPSKSKSKGKERSREGKSELGDKIVNEIMEEFITSLGKGAVDTNVFQQADSKSTASNLLPHPRNLKNREIEAKEMAIIQRCKDEQSKWARLTNESNRKLHAVIEETRDKRSRNEEPDLSDAAWLQDALRIADGIIAEGEGDLTKVGEFDDVEFKVDLLLSSSHVAVQYAQQAQRFLDGVFSSLTLDLRKRQRAGLSLSLVGGEEQDGPDAVALLAASGGAAASSSGAVRKDPMLMLRALASADSKAQNDEAIAAAARVAPVHPSAQSGSHPLSASVGPGVSATPRRMATATPRRAGQSANQVVPRSAGPARGGE